MRDATVSGIVRLQGTDRAFTAIFDRKYPMQAGAPPTSMVRIEGMPAVTGTVSGVIVVGKK